MKTFTHSIGTNAKENWVSINSFQHRPIHFNHPYLRNMLWVRYTKN